MPADSVPGKGPLPGLQRAAFLLCSHMKEREGALVYLPLLIKALVLSDEGSTFINSVKHHCLTGLTSKQSHMGLRSLTCESMGEGTDILSLIPSVTDALKKATLT